MIRRTIACLTASMALAPVAHAFLGGERDAVADEAGGAQVSIKTSAAAGAEVLEFADPSGTLIREFANQRGTIFAVSWQGPVAPDLPSLLGTHYAAYRAYLGTLGHPGLHRSIRMSTPELVVESGGHLRAYAGRACLTAEAPAGLRLLDLR